MKRIISTIAKTLSEGLLYILLTLLYFVGFGFLWIIFYFNRTHDKGYKTTFWQKPRFTGNEELESYHHQS